MKMILFDRVSSTLSYELRAASREFLKPLCLGYEKFSETELAERMTMVTQKLPEEVLREQRMMNTVSLKIKGDGR